MYFKAGLWNVALGGKCFTDGLLYVGECCELVVHQYVCLYKCRKAFVISKICDHGIII